MPLTPHGGWTLETLRVHLEARIDGAERLNTERALSQEKSVAAALKSATSAIEAALASADRAVSKAEVAAEKRFESVNEFRNTLADQQRGLIPRSEFEAMEKAVAFRLDAIDKQMAEQRAERMGIKGGWGYAAGVAGLVIAVISIAAALTQWART